MVHCTTPLAAHATTVRPRYNGYGFKGYPDLTGVPYFKPCDDLRPATCMIYLQW